MKIFSLFLALISALLMCNGCRSANSDIDEELLNSFDETSSENQMNGDIKYYGFEFSRRGTLLNNSPFKFSIESINRDEGYSLVYKPKNIKICSKIYYVKTFGGVMPTVNIAFYKNRYLVFPETIKNSAVAGKMFYPMKAVTNIFDLETQRIIYRSKPYIYDHDVPLRFSENDFIDKN